MKEPILSVNNCCTWFDVTRGLFSKKQIVKAVDNVSFQIYPGETFGLVGESGCGKSTLGRTIVKIYSPTSGTIQYKGQDITHLQGSHLKDYRKQVQMIFQDPYASLDPRMTVGEIVREPMDIHQLHTKKEREERVAQLLQIVGLKPDHIRRYPHEFSGGQRQRIGIARTLALDPEFIVCDEPISALDVSIQAQIVNLLVRLQKDRQLTMLFIAHDLSMVKHISDRIGIMYLGKMVETAGADELYRRPLHPYAQALLAAAPIADPKASRERKKSILAGEVPSPLNPPPGCRFSSRCPYRTDRCSQQLPPLLEAEPGHFAACWLYHK